jgi:hypothetical protein
MKSILLIVAFTALASCATTTYAPKTDTGTTAVFIRLRAEPTAWNVAVTVDGKKAASIGNKSHARFSVTPGIHQVVIDWPSLAGQHDLYKTIDFVAGTTSYFLITADYADFGAATVGAGMVMTYNSTVGLVELTEQAGKDFLAALAKK